MMHGAITVGGGKTKHEARSLQPLQQIWRLTVKARHLTTATTAVARRVSVGLYCLTQLVKKKHTADHMEKMG